MYDGIDRKKCKCTSMPVTYVSTRVKPFRFHLSCEKYSALRPDTRKSSSSAWKRSRLVWRFSFARFFPFSFFLPLHPVAVPRKNKKPRSRNPSPFTLPPPSTATLRRFYRVPAVVNTRSSGRKEARTVR